jgi:hypothetical protein
MSLGSRPGRYTFLSYYCIGMPTLSGPWSGDAATHLAYQGCKRYRHSHCFGMHAKGPLPARDAPPSPATPFSHPGEGAVPLNENFPLSW